MTVEEVRKIYEFLPPIGRAALLLMFCTGMRIGEIIQFKESDIEGRIIHLSAKYCKGGHGRDVVMTTECQAFLNTIWLPQKPEYLAVAVRRNIGLQVQSKTPEKSAGIKSLDDDRVVPCSKATLYEILMLGFRRAGFGTKKDGRNIYHPHGLGKSFRSIVGSVHPDLAESLMGHEGYLTSSYVRLDLLKEYQKVEGLLSMGSTEATESKLRSLEEENKDLQKRLLDLEKKQELSRKVNEMLSSSDRAEIAKMLADELRQNPGK
jgi:integrase